MKLARLSNKMLGFAGMFALMAFVAILAPLFFIVTTLFSWSYYKERKQFAEEYKNFLKEYEGHEFFCYTNRKKYVSAIENTLIPQLAAPVHIIKLVGRSPETDLQQSFVSQMLYNVKSIGFPNVMKIVAGEVVDYSLHKQVYNALHQGKVSEIKSIIAHGFSQLRAG